MTKPPPTMRSRIALWTPLPPQKTGIADYIAELLPHLNEYYDLEIFVEEYYETADEFRSNYKIYPHYSYTRRDQKQPFDLNIYEMGNNSYHLFVYKQALRVPGLVVLHDLSISYLLFHYYIEILNNMDKFEEEFAYSEGEAAFSIFRDHYKKGKHEELMQFFGAHYMLRRLSDRSYSFLTHVEHGPQVLTDRYQAKQASSMYLGSPDPYEELGLGTDKLSCRQSLGIQEDEFVIGVFGILQATKQNDISLRALSRLLKKHPGLVMTFVGEVNPSGGYDDYITSLISQLGVEDNVQMTGHVSRENFLKHFIACDVAVNLRYPSFGEMSATLSLGIAAGKPMIISDIPEWRFIPEEFCWRVSPTDLKGHELEKYLSLLIQNPKMVADRGHKAREFYLQNGTIQHAAGNMQDAIKRTIDIIPDYDLDEWVEDEPKNIVGEQVRRLFSEWESTWTGSKNRIFLRRIRKLPLFGSLFYFGYRILESMRNYSEIRTNQSNLYKALTNGIARLEAAANNRLKTIEIMQDKLINQNKAIQALQETIQSREQQLLELRSDMFELYKLPEVRELDDPLAQLETAEIYQAWTKQVNTTGEDERYPQFGNAFRGSYESISERMERIIPKLSTLISDFDKPVLDVGCGRGEFLSLLKENEVPAIGIDTNALLIERLKDTGFEVYKQDANSYLEEYPDESFAGVVAFHVIEHLEHEYLKKFLELVQSKLIPNGFLYLETPNPFNFEALSNFFTDHTHQRPFQPFQLSFLLNYYGFTKMKLLFLEPVTTRGSISEERWMRHYLDFGIIAQKPGS